MNDEFKSLPRDVELPGDPPELRRWLAQQRRARTMRETPSDFIEGVPADLDDLDGPS